MPIIKPLLDRKWKPHSPSSPPGLSLVYRKGRIVGIVTDSGKRPIEGVRLSIQNLPNQGTSRYDGTFEIPEIRIGWINLVLEHEHFDPLVLQYINVQQGTVDLGTISLPAKKTDLRSPFRSRLVKSAQGPAGAGEEGRGWISGRVADESGKPLPFARVRVYLHDLESMSDSNGIFLITGVPAGEYMLLVDHEGFDAQFLPHVRVADNGTSLDTICMNERMFRNQPPAETSGAAAGRCDRSARQYVAGS